MVDDFNISQFFLADHDRFYVLINQFKRLQAIESQDLNLFKKIIWEIEKHIYLEERSYYTICELQRKLDHNFISKLTGQHDKILKILKSMLESVEKNELINMNELIGELDFHIDFEKEFFYDNMEKALNPDQKREIKTTLDHSAKLGFYPIEKMRTYALKKLKTLCRD